MFNVHYIFPLAVKVSAFLELKSKQCDRTNVKNTGLLEVDSLEEKTLSSITLNLNNRCKCNETLNTLMVTPLGRRINNVIHRG